MKSSMLALTAFMNLGLYLNVRILVLPSMSYGTHWWIVFFIYGLIFQFNWVLLMVGALWEVQSSFQKANQNE